MSVTQEDIRMPKQSQPSEEELVAFAKTLAEDRTRASGRTVTTEEALHEIRQLRVPPSEETRKVTECPLSSSGVRGKTHSFATCILPTPQSPLLY